MVFNLLTADEFTLAEAACMLHFTDPMMALMNPQTRDLHETHDALVHVMTAIEDGELPCMEPSEDVLRRSKEQQPYVYIATCRREVYDPALHEQRSRYVVKRANLIDFGFEHEYPCAALLLGNIARPGISSAAGSSRGGKKGAVTKRAEQEVRNLRIDKLFAKGKSARKVATIFHLSPSQARRIRNRPR